MFVLAIELYLLVTVMQAQKLLGNRWTEIAKVVSGRWVFLLNYLLLQGEIKDKQRDM